MNPFNESDEQIKKRLEFLGMKKEIIEGYADQNNEFFKPQNMVSEKSRLTTFLLCFIFGVFGAHRFYAGKHGTAILQILFTISVVGFVITSIWLFVDLLMIIMGSFTDKTGNKITNWNA